jgi:hypothetical protein
MFALARFDLKNPEKKISLRLEASFRRAIAQMMMISRLAVLEQRDRREKETETERHLHVG